MTKDEALKLALEALEEAWYHVGTFQPTEKAIDLYDEARAAIKEALAQPEQEPVAWFSTLPDGRLSIKIVGKPTEGNWEPLYTTQPKAQPEQEPSITKTGYGVMTLHSGFNDLPVGTKFYTTPPQRTWVGLTDEECKGMSAGDRVVAMWAARTLKEKNT